MFNNALYFNQDIKNWNVSNVTTTKEMFRNAKSFNQILNVWNVSAVIDMSFMFYNTMVIKKQYQNKWDIDKTVNVKNMFKM